jgi:hypothetical protein
VRLCGGKGLTTLSHVARPLWCRCAQLYGGKDKSTYKLEKDEAQEEHRRRRRDADLDRDHINKTLLRSTRIEKLRELTGEGASSVPLIPDGVVDDAAMPAAPGLLLDAAAAPASDLPLGEEPVLAGTRSCYVCKCRFRKLHHFYDQLCPECAAFNFLKRHQTANLEGYVAVVTGGRVKIGQHVCV